MKKSTLFGLFAILLASVFTMNFSIKKEGTSESLSLTDVSTVAVAEAEQSCPKNSWVCFSMQGIYARGMRNN